MLYIYIAINFSLDPWEWAYLYNFAAEITSPKSFLLCIESDVFLRYRYCDCFANGEFCREGCQCHNCKNNVHHAEERARAVKVDTSLTYTLSIYSVYLRYVWTEIPMPSSRKLVPINQ